MFKKEKIVRQDNKTNYHDITEKAYHSAPDDIIAQIEYVKENGTSQHYIMFLVSKAQVELSNYPTLRGKDMIFKQGTVEYLLRGILDALKHMQDNLPEGVFEYITGNLEPAMINILQEHKRISNN